VKAHKIIRTQTGQNSISPNTTIFVRQYNLSSSCRRVGINCPIGHLYWGWYWLYLFISSTHNGLSHVKKLCKYVTEHRQRLNFTFNLLKKTEMYYSNYIVSYLFCVVSSSCSRNVLAISETVTQSFPFATYPNHNWIIFLLFDDIYSKLLTAQLNK
jgi:hypothetical protein